MVVRLRVEGEVDYTNSVRDTVSACVAILNNLRNGFHTVSPKFQHSFTTRFTQFHSVSRKKEWEGSGVSREGKGGS